MRQLLALRRVAGRELRCRALRPPVGAGGSRGALHRARSREGRGRTWRPSRGGEARPRQRLLDAGPGNRYGDHHGIEVPGREAAPGCPVVPPLLVESAGQGPRSPPLRRVARVRGPPRQGQERDGPVPSLLVSKSGQRLCLVCGLRSSRRGGVCRALAIAGVHETPGGLPASRKPVPDAQVALGQVLFRLLLRGLPMVATGRRKTA
mmetsp:Transcript_15703/g.37300  ORF Transcript_15703/g.37300 Transcript_15703/m.37300 type:complete len:206 (+) Transcript_15703:585-1202(+)